LLAAAGRPASVSFVNNCSRHDYRSPRKLRLDLLRRLQLLLLHRQRLSNEHVELCVLHQAAFTFKVLGGAATTPFAETIGALEVGRAADIVLIDWHAISYPYLDPETPVLDAVLQRAKTGGVRTVICDGEVIYQDGKFTRVDRDGALRALYEELQRTLSDDEVERRRLSKSLLPHVRAFCANYFDPDQHAPIDRQNGERQHDTVTSEARRIFENLKLLLESTGLSLDRLVKVHAMIYSCPLNRVALGWGLARAMLEAGRIRGFPPPVTRGGIGGERRRIE
jgi:hypothetical protein